MISLLRTIVQEVNSARNLPQVLSIIVKEVRDAMQAGVCSVYLFDEADQRYVLMATEGLRKESIGKVRLSMKVVDQATGEEVKPEAAEKSDD